MFAKLGLAAAAVGLAAVALRGGPSERAYPVPIAEARAMLLAADVPTGIFGSATGEMETDVMPVESSDVRWTVTYDGKPMLRYTARLAAVDPARTKVTVELAAADPKLAKRMEENASIIELYRVTMEEKVSSVLERRPFDLSAAYPALGSAIAANIDTIGAGAAAAGEAAQKRDRDNIARAYADEAAGR